MSLPAEGRAPVLAGWRHMQVAVLLAFGCIALAAGWQAWQAQRLVDAQRWSARIVDAAQHHRTQIERLGRLAAVMVARPDPAEATAAELSRERDQARRLAQDFRQVLEEASQASHRSAHAVAPTLVAWHDARKRLLAGIDDLLVHAAARRSEAFAESAAAVQREAERAGSAAQNLAQALRAAAEGLQSRTIREARIGAGLTVVVLLLLSIGVLSPALRTLQQQSRRLTQQAGVNQRLALVAEHTGNLVVITDRERRLVWANEAFTRLTGYELHEVLGRSPGALLQSERTDPATVERVRDALQSGRPARVELLNRSRDGRDYWIDADIQPLRNAAGDLIGFIAVETVITEQVTQRLRSAALLDAMPAAVVVHAQDGTVLQANPAARALLPQQAGDRAEGLMQLHPRHDDQASVAPADLPVLRTLRNGQGDRGQLLGVDDGQGGQRWLLVNTEPLRDALGAPDGAVACYVDMTERRHLLEELRNSARSDPLTQLPNRSVVLERVQRALDHRRRHPDYGFAVLFMDVDRFKQVNDTLGHGAGDALLRQVADRLNEELRPGDAVGRVESSLLTAARMGGDEFVVVLEGIRELDDACRVADRILESLSQPYQLGSHRVHVSVSIGIVGAAQADAEADADAVLRDCDTAMYEAKRAGRGRWLVFDPSMHERVRTALETEGDLRRALAEDQLYVVYQPVVDLGDRQLTGVEALVRWRHPERGEIPPAAFIGLAEECGLIDDIGDVVLNKACAQFAQWQQQWGQRAPKLLAVNLSRAQLKQPGLVPEVMAVLEANDMQPAQLQLEVTESFAAQDLQVQSMLQALKAAGVRLALDDFGTGYSSLACLHQLPVDTVKVDRSFVAHAREVEYHRVLIQATIRVARTLGMTTVAEGIETEDQADLMTSLQCDRGQGWLFGKAMSAAELDRWIEREATGTVA